MTFVPSYLNRAFKVDDPDARLRDPDNLLFFLRYQAGEEIPPGASPGDFKRIAVGTKLRVSQIRIAEAGSTLSAVFALVSDPTTNAPIGWTAVGNLEGGFIGETLGVIAPASGAGKFSDTAAWSGGNYTGQIELVQIINVKSSPDVIAASTADPFLKMVDAARQDKVQLALSSGFRTYSEQNYLWKGYTSGKVGFNLAAKPGYSAHQNGVAFDITVAGSFDSPQYLWLAKNATGFGFIRTVSGEPWHWEYRPDAALKAKKKGAHKLASVAP